MKFETKLTSILQSSSLKEFKLELSKFKFQSLPIHWHCQAVSRTFNFTGGCGPRGSNSEWGDLPGVTSQSQWQVRAASCSQGLWAPHAGGAATATGRCPIIHGCSSSLQAWNLGAVSEHRLPGHGPRLLSRIQMLYRQEEILVVSTGRNPIVLLQTKRESWNSCVRSSMRVWFCSYDVRRWSAIYFVSINLISLILIGSIIKLKPISLYQFTKFNER